MLSRTIASASPTGWPRTRNASQISTPPASQPSARQAAQRASARAAAVAQGDLGVEGRGVADQRPPGGAPGETLDRSGEQREQPTALDQREGEQQQAEQGQPEREVEQLARVAQLLHQQHDPERGEGDLGHEPGRQIDHDAGAGGRRRRPAACQQARPHELTSDLSDRQQTIDRTCRSTA